MHQFVSKVEKYILEHHMLEKKDTVVLGVSGGADSTALFLVLLELRQKYDWDLSVVCVNHGLREEAVSEAKSVEMLCKDNGIAFFLKEYRVNEIAKELGKGTEETGRMLRYKAFNEVLKNSKAGKGKIAVAHNMSDQAETMLFHLFRGTGITGLASIAPVRDNIIRPLLCTSREEIEEYLSYKKTGYSTDKSNFSSEYTRNRIRNNLIPQIKNDVSDAAVLHMFETASQLREIDSFVKSYAKTAYDKIKIAGLNHLIVSFSKEAFVKEDVYIKKLLIKMAIDELVPGNRDITHKHIESLVNLVGSEGYHEINLPYSLTGYVSYEEIGLKLPIVNNKSFEPVKIKLGESISIPGVGTFYSELIEKDAFDPARIEYTKCFDYDKIIESLEIRTRKPGDYLIVNKDGGKKKLKDYFIDEKIPTYKRDSIPVIADGNKIIWAVGLRISEDLKVTNETKRVIKITCKLEE